MTFFKQMQSMEVKYLARFPGKKRGRFSRYYGIAAIVIGAMVTIATPQSAMAKSCLYPDKRAGAPPSYSCLKPSERKFVDLRKFRAELTVAALRCDQQRLYNKVVKRHKRELVTNGKALAGTFRRLHGSSATRELNRFVTHLTNKASIRSFGIRNYCHSMSRVFADAIRAPVQGLLTFINAEWRTRLQHRAPARGQVTAPRKINAVSRSQK